MCIRSVRKCAVLSTTHIRVYTADVPNSGLGRTECEFVCSVEAFKCTARCTADVEAHMACVRNVQYHIAEYTTAGLKCTVKCTADVAECMYHAGLYDISYCGYKCLFDTFHTAQLAVQQ